MLSPKTIKLCDSNLRLANTKSRNDFIEKAINHYAGYLNRNENSNYLNKVIDETLRNKINLLEEQLSKVIFKLSVELGMMMQIIAASTDIDEKTLELLRQKSVEDVQETIGKINLKDIIKNQKKDGDT